ncbi:hypothetical protein ACFPU1_13035 [Thalassorhabdus alkalitolerans]|uniref:SprT-like family protein n=1 Tax=Thalassorhabdus alkalitolerans TaxID=2282697 RepID=A0ABW0YMN7_9BACI
MEEKVFHLAFHHLVKMIIPELKQTITFKVDSSINTQAAAIRSKENHYEINVNSKKVVENYKKVIVSHGIRLAQFKTYVYIILLHELGHCTKQKQEDPLKNFIKDHKEALNVGDKVRYVKSLDLFINEYIKEEKRAWEWAINHTPEAVCEKQTVENLARIFVEASAYRKNEWKKDRVSFFHRFY